MECPAMRRAPDVWWKSIRTAIAAGVFATAMTACAPYQVVDVPSTNQSSRVDYVVVHFTSENYAESMRLLTQPSLNPVSSHYLIPEQDDETYPREAPVIHRLVPELRRAWHAGRSNWAGADSLNDRSIGIELVNVSRCAPGVPDANVFRALEAACRFEAFDATQIELLVTLMRDLLERYPGIDPVDVVGHSDIAPQRKTDPGPLFPWQQLYDAGIGAWYDDDTRARYREAFRQSPPSVTTIQTALAAYGYPIEVSGVMGIPERNVIRAFQMHFTPDNATGAADIETVSTLFALLEKYRPDTLAELGDLAPDVPAASP